MMKILVTGATGYIGGRVAERLRDAQYEVWGFVRSAAGAKHLGARGIRPVLGNIEDTETLATYARQVDAVVNTADSDNRGAIEAILSALAGTGKIFIQNSGSSIVSDSAAGERGDRIFAEDTPFTPLPQKLHRVHNDQLVKDAPAHKVHGIVICPTLIYGRWPGIHQDTVQLRMLIEQSLESGTPRYIGRGENIWSHVHIDDLAELYLLALRRAPAGSFFFAESGEECFRKVVESIARMLGMEGRAASWSLPEAIKEWGPRAETALASNSRVRAVKARELLGWAPRGPGLLEEIERGSYWRHYGAGRGS